MTTPAFFISADWSKDERKRSVHTADLRNRRIWREECAGWNLQALLKRAGELTKHGAVLVGIDAVLGVPAGYWREVQRAGQLGRFVTTGWIRRLARPSRSGVRVLRPCSRSSELACRPTFLSRAQRQGGRSPSLHEQVRGWSPAEDRPGHRRKPDIRRERHSRNGRVGNWVVVDGADSSVGGDPGVRRLAVRG